MYLGLPRFFAVETFDCPESREESGDYAKGDHSEDQTNNKTDGHSAKKNRCSRKREVIEERSVLPRE